MRKNTWFIALTGVPVALTLFVSDLTPTPSPDAPCSAISGVTASAEPLEEARVPDVFAGALRIAADATPRADAMTAEVDSTPEALPAPTAVEAVVRAATAPAAPSARRLSAAERAAIAAELERLQTRNPRELVEVIADAAEEMATPIDASFLLAIAHTETHGNVLAVSPAGAAGLAQATPAAFLLEGVGGPLFVTSDYLMATRAYITKKPLGDAVHVADEVLAGRLTRADALALVERAKDLRRAGFDELDALVPHAPDLFRERVAAADQHNARTLETLEALLTGPADDAALASLRDAARADFRALADLQKVGWARYGKALEAERDRLLREAFGMDPVTVMKTRRYEAGELLGERLDARFSPTRMARFLSQHLMTKRGQAIAAGIPEGELEVWTAALYNGGLVNVQRLRAGLIPSIKETRDYMKKVPDMRLRLDRAAGVTPRT